MCACAHTKTTQNNTTTPTPPHTRILIEYGIRIETANTNRSQQALASQPKKLELIRREHEDGARWTASPTTYRKSTEAATKPGSLPPPPQTKEGSFAAASKTNRTNALWRKSNTNYHTRKQTLFCREPSPAKLPTKRTLPPNTHTHTHTHHPPPPPHPHTHTKSHTHTHTHTHRHTHTRTGPTRTSPTNRQND